MTTPKARIEEAMKALTDTIEREGYQVSDYDLDAVPQDAVELYRYPPEEYDQVICAVPAKADDQTPAGPAQQGGTT